MSKQSLLFFFLFFSLNVYGAEITWVINAVGNWNDSSNWVGGTVPGSGDQAVINSGEATLPSGVSATIETLSVGISAELIIEANATLNLSDISTSDDLFDLSGTLNNYGTIQISGAMGGGYIHMKIAAGGNFQNHANAELNIQGANASGGMWSYGTMNNAANALIEISEFNLTTALRLFGGTYTNSGELKILNAQTGILAGGQVGSMSTFINHGLVEIIGSGGATTGSGIVAMSNFENADNGEIYINNFAGTGFTRGSNAQFFGSVQNSGLLEIGPSIGVTGMQLNRDLTNNSCGTIKLIEADIEFNAENPTFTNNGVFIFDYEVPFNSGGYEYGNFVNNGLTEDIHNSIHPNSFYKLYNTQSHAGWLLKPVTGTFDAEEATSFSLFGTGTGISIVGNTLYTDEALTTSAGTYDSAAETWTPSPAAVNLDLFYAQFDNGAACPQTLRIKLSTPVPCYEAVENNWTGGGDGADWHDPNNWSLGVPSECHMAFIPSSISGEIVISQTTRVASINAPSASIRIESSVNVYIKGNKNGNNNHGLAIGSGSFTNYGWLDISKPGANGMQFGNNSVMNNYKDIDIEDVDAGYAYSATQAQIYNSPDGRIDIKDIAAGGMHLSNSTFTNDGWVDIDGVGAEGLTMFSSTLTNNEAFIIENTGGVGLNLNGDTEASAAQLITKGQLDISSTDLSGTGAAPITMGVFSGIEGNGFIITNDDWIDVFTQLTVLPDENNFIIAGDVQLLPESEIKLTIAGNNGPGDVAGNGRIEAYSLSFVLDGTLNIELSNGFSPEITDEFILMDAPPSVNPFSGMFNNVNLPAGMEDWTVAINATQDKVVLRSSCYIWTGGTGNWSDGSNWACGMVPTMTDRVIIPDGNITLDVPVTLNDLTMRGGTLTGTQSLSLNNNWTWSGGTINCPLSLGNNCVIDIPSTATACNLDALNASFAGTINLAGGTLNLNNGTSFTASGTLNLQGGKLHIASGNTFTNTGMIDIAAQGEFFSGSGILINDGTIEQTIAGADFRISENDALTLQNNGTFKKSQGGVIQLGNNAVFENNGIIAGIGGINFNNADFTHNGSIRPGNSPGTLFLSKLDNSNGSIDIELSSTSSFDILNIAQEPFTLAGTLNISFIDGFTPSIGDSFEFLISTSNLSGAFSTINHPGENPNAWEVNYIAKNATLDLVGSLLPVEFLSFDAEQSSEKEILLTWSTATEYNADYFEVQRRSETGDWKSIGRTEARDETSSVSSYQFTDRDFPQGEKFYYRLEQFDRDGSSTFSPVVSVLPTYSEAAAVYPNPARDFLFVKSEQLNESNINYALRDVTGKTIYLKHREESGTICRLQLPQNLPDGLYYLSVSREGKILFSERVTVVR